MNIFISDILILRKRDTSPATLPFPCPEHVSVHDCYNSLMAVWIRRLMTQDHSKDS